MHLCGWGSPKEEGGERKDEEVNRKSVCVLAHHLLRASVWLCVFGVHVWCVYRLLWLICIPTLFSKCEGTEKKEEQNKEAYLSIHMLSLCVVTT